MLHAHLAVITADPKTLGSCIDYIEHQARPMVESQRDGLGLLLLASPGDGVAIFESLWAQHVALDANEEIAAALRGEVAGQAGGSVTAARYQMPVFEHDAPLDGGERVRVTRIEVKPSAVTDVNEAFGDSAVPLLAPAPGFRSALLLADPDSGHLVSQTIWRDPQTRAASPSVAELIEADLLPSASCQIRAVEDYNLVFSSAREA